VSQLLFNWVNPVIARGVKFTEDDLFELEQWDRADDLANRLRSAWQAELKAHPSDPYLGRAYLAAFLRQYAINSTWVTVKAAFMLAQTQFLALLLTELSGLGGARATTAAYLYALGLVLTGASAALMHHLYFIHAWRAGMRWRIAASALIFEKSLALRLDSLSAVSAGHVVNLAANDIERFQKLCQYLAYLVVAPAECVVIMG
jgi:ATP-binding cassette subfamily C (CFTR/MRP) protein 4